MIGRIFDRWAVVHFVRLFENYISSPFFEDDFFHVTYVQVMYLF
jgi:hypothetical protein